MNKDYDRINGICVCGKKAAAFKGVTGKTFFWCNNQKCCTVSFNADEKNISENETYKKSLQTLIKNLKTKIKTLENDPLMDDYDVMPEYHGKIEAFKETILALNRIIRYHNKQEPTP